MPGLVWNIGCNRGKGVVLEVRLRENQDNDPVVDDDGEEDDDEEEEDDDCCDGNVAMEDELLLGLFLSELVLLLLAVVGLVCELPWRRNEGGKVNADCDPNAAVETELSNPPSGR